MSIETGPFKAKYIKPANDLLHDIRVLQDSANNLALDAVKAFTDANNQALDQKNLQSLFKQKSTLIALKSQVTLMDTKALVMSVRHVSDQKKKFDAKEQELEDGIEQAKAAIQPLKDSIAAKQPQIDGALQTINDNVMKMLGLLKVAHDYLDDILNQANEIVGADQNADTTADTDDGAADTLAVLVAATAAGDDDKIGDANSVSQDSGASGARKGWGAPIKRAFRMDTVHRDAREQRRNEKELEKFQKEQDKEQIISLNSLVRDNLYPEFGITDKFKAPKNVSPDNYNQFLQQTLSPMKEAIEDLFVKAWPEAFKTDAGGNPTADSVGETVTFNTEAGPVEIQVPATKTQVANLADVLGNCVSSLEIKFAEAKVALMGVKTFVVDFSAVDFSADAE